ncbi:MAG: PKD domain-containing protein [Bacteroidales bacterium]|nr:PKD domain-containing protein [Bacteroidales bacterium]
MRYIRLLILVLLLTGNAIAQTDNVFWFGAPDVSSVHGDAPQNGTPINLHITAIHATHVTVSRPADPGFTPIELDLTEMEHSTLRLDNNPITGNLSIAQIETYPSNDLDNGMQNKGFLIESDPGEITAYYELDNTFNRDIFPLKGGNALGTNFYVSTQNRWRNGDYSGTAWSGFVVVATEDNTTVTVYQNDGWLYFPASPAIRTVVLNRGETFAFRAASVNANRHINGVRVTSDNPIAITTYDDSVWKEPDGCKDILGDQIVPVDLIGQEYIVMKGFLSSEERVFITGTVNGTQISIDGGAPVATINAGEMYTTTITNRATRFYASQPVYLMHTTGFGCELGGALLPTIDGCTGSHDVTFTRTPNTGDAFYVNIMVRNDTAALSPFRNQSIHNFTLKVNGSVYNIPSNYFEFTGIDSAFAVLRDDPVVHAFFTGNIPPGEEAQVSNSISRFHLGVINGGGASGCKYGYFSDYAESGASAGIGGAYLIQQDVYCNLDPIKLVASGGRAYSWEMTFPDIDTIPLSAMISDTAAADPYFYPPGPGDYYFRVTVYGECFTEETIDIITLVRIGPTSDFILGGVTGCSPFSTTIDNTTVGHDSISVWLIGNPPVTINQDTMPDPFIWEFPENNTDTIQTHTISLYSYADEFYSCKSVRTKTVKVKPRITAGFEVDDSVGCHPLTVNFTNLTTGNYDSTSYYWDFDDNTQSSERDPVNVYDNYSLIDTVYYPQLMVESPYGCRDSITDTIVVHPRVRARMTLDQSASCSPLSIDMNPVSSVGVDTFYWHIDYVYDDSIYSTTTKDLVPLYHQDTSLAGPDTLAVTLWGINRMNCVDTFQTRYIVVYPEVQAEFGVSADTVCDSTRIDFTNNSFGYQLYYEWNFDDGTNYSDTTGDPYSHIFFNRSDVDSTYNVTLSATSAYFCESSFDTNIVVHPFVRANFGIEYENNCSPLLATISNLSVQADTNKWDFGDGTPVTYEDAASFIHSFQNLNINTDTTYTVSLVTLNDYGCSDTSSREIDIFPEVVADFNISDSVGCSPRSVMFHNRSTGGLLSFLWDFGNSTSGVNPAPDFPKTYTNYSQTDTTYYVTLTVSNPYGCDDEDYDSVTVFASIDAEFSMPVTDTCSPFTMRFENLSSVGAQVYEWDFLGTAIPTQNDFEPVLPPFSNTSLTEDTILVRLVAYGVNDAPHRACADTHSVQVVVFPELDVDFDLSNVADCQPLIAEITNNTNITSGTTFRWVLDGLFYSSIQNPPTLVVPNYGSTTQIHNLQLSGVSNYGCRDTIDESFTVYSLVDAKFTIDRAGICSRDTIVIDRSNSRGGITEYEWDFNGEATDNRTDEVFEYSFANITASPQTNYISLTVTNGEIGSSGVCDSTWIQTINVYPEVTASFELDANEFCYPDTTVFTNLTDNAVNYFWDFGDGSNSNQTNPQHVFNNFDQVNDETFTVNLLARSTYNCYDDTSINITVWAKPDADFEFDETVDCPPFEAQMRNSSTGNNLDYHWDFGGIDESFEEEPSYIFGNETSEILSVDITLTVTSERGCTDFLVRTLSVYPNVQVSMEILPGTEGCSPLYIDFIGDTINVNSMIWYIDEQGFSTLKDPSYRFVNNSPGNETFDVTFRGFSVYNCTDDTTVTITVYPTPSAEFIPEEIIHDYDTENDATTVTFQNETLFQDNWRYSWDFGDGTGGEDDELIFNHVYGFEFWGDPDDNFRIPVRMIAYNQDNEECLDTVWNEIYIYAPVPEIALEEDVSGCEPLTVDFSAITNYVYEDQYEWDFGIPGETSTEETPSFTYTEPGVYTAKLIVRGDGGTNWDYRLITVYPKPIVDFSFNDSVVFVRSQNRPDEVINFYNHTQFGENYEWYFENNLDGGIPDSYEQNPTWYYSETGTYYVALVAQSDQTCLDTLISPIPIRVLGEASVQFPTGFFVDPAGARDGYVSDPEDTDLRIFRPYAQGVEKYNLEVYNRWGVLVFESNDVNYGWNGYINGEPAKQDVYLYRAKGRFTNGQPFEISGDVTLIVAPVTGGTP